MLRISLVATALLCAACASSTRFEARGWLNPYKTGEGELIGTFKSQEKCQAAVDYWLSRQVVGNPISGECEPAK
jgi:hypothetical protein